MPERLSFQLWIVPSADMDKTFVLSAYVPVSTLFQAYTWTGPIASFTSFSRETSKFTLRPLINSPCDADWKYFKFKSIFLS